MNLAVWIVQSLTGAAFVAAGYGHGFNLAASTSRPGMQWMAAIPNPMLIFIGVSEILGGIGLILPALTGILPWLTPVAALGLVVMMILAIGFHLSRREYQNIVINSILLLLAALVAFGRWELLAL